MKVIRQGTIERFTYGATCRNCGCVIEFTKEDGEVVRDWRDGDFIRVNCPTCNASITHQL